MMLFDQCMYGVYWFKLKSAITRVIVVGRSLHVVAMVGSVDDIVLELASLKTYVEARKAAAGSDDSIAIRLGQAVAQKIMHLPALSTSDAPKIANAIP